MHGLLQITPGNTGDIAGVFNGAFYIDSTGKPTFANSVVAGTVTTSKDYNTGSDNITAFANTNPAQEYSVRTKCSSCRLCRSSSS